MDPLGDVESENKSGASNSPSELIEGRLVNEHVIYSIK